MTEKIKMDQKVGVDEITLSFKIKGVNSQILNERYKKEIGHPSHNLFNFGEKDERIFEAFIKGRPVKQIKIEFNPYQIVRVFKHCGQVRCSMILKVKPKYAMLGNINNNSWDEVMQSVEEVRNRLHSEWGIQIAQELFVANIEINKTFIMTHSMEKLVGVWDEHVKYYSSIRKKGTYDVGCGNAMQKTGFTYTMETIYLKVYDKIAEINDDKNKKSKKYNTCNVSTDANVIRLEFRIFSKKLKKYNLNQEIHTIKGEDIELAYNRLVDEYIIQAIGKRDKDARIRLEEIIESAQMNNIVLKLTECVDKRPRALMCVDELDEQMIRLNDVFSKKAKRNLAAIKKRLKDGGWIPRMAREETRDVLDEFMDKATNRLEEVEIDVIVN